MSDLKLPKFENEKEEARWWHDNRELVAEEFVKAAKAGRLRRGDVKRLLAERGVSFQESGSTPTTTIRLDPEDIARARVQAAERGLRYQTYLKMIIHEALRKTEQKRKSS